jgi:DNA-binding FadR family transcriptional regulator
MPIQFVEPQRLYRQIAGQLRGLIASGEYAVGARLPAERDLAKQLGVSRPSVREALIALEVEGLVEVRTGSGVYVQMRRPVDGHGSASASEWGPLEVIRARRLVEGETAALAAIGAKRYDLKAMEAALAAMRAGAEAGGAPLDADREFHSAVAQAGGNMVLTETVQRFCDARSAPLFARLGGHFENQETWRAAVAEHEVVLAAIRARDAFGARAAMQAHLDNAHARFSVSWSRAKSSPNTTVKTMARTTTKAVAKTNAKPKSARGLKAT